MHGLRNQLSEYERPGREDVVPPDPIRADEPRYAVSIDAGLPQAIAEQPIVPVGDDVAPPI